MTVDCKAPIKRKKPHLRLQFDWTLSLSLGKMRKDANRLKKRIVLTLKKNKMLCIPIKNEKKNQKDYLKMEKNNVKLYAFPFFDKIQ